MDINVFFFFFFDIVFPLFIWNACVLQPNCLREMNKDELNWITLGTVTGTATPYWARAAPSQMFIICACF